MLNLEKQFEKKRKKNPFTNDRNITEYVVWLEKKLEDIHDMCYEHEELPDGYYDTEAVRRDETLNEIIKRIEQ